MFDVFINNRKLACGVDASIVYRMTRDLPKSMFSVYKHNSLKSVNKEMLSCSHT